MLGEREGQGVGDCCQPRRARIPGRGLQGNAPGPCDSYVWIIVGETALLLRRVVGRGHIDDVGDVTDDAEPVRKPVRAVELVVVGIAQRESLPVAEARGPTPDVN